jgi:hypothetical protein
MNTVVKILLYLAKMLNLWIFVIPMKLTLFATFINLGIMYLIFGTASMGEIKYHILDGNLIGQLAVWILLGLPAFMGFVHMMAPTAIGSNINDNLNGLISHRNNMMNHASSKEAYEIMKKTAHLDVISSRPEFKNAVMGFNATVGKDSTSKAYKDMMGK